MPALSIPFEPIRKSLYSVEELFSDFDLRDRTSFGKTKDFEIFRYFVGQGRTAPKEYFASMMQSLHDNSVTQAINLALEGRKCVAIMGGHKLGRKSPQYAAVATLAAMLTRSGFVVASGGGPGAMEATHLGAVTSSEGPGFLADAIEQLSACPILPSDISDIVSVEGEPNESVVQAMHEWISPAFRVLANVKTPAMSLAVPTWHYGHEPTTPLATSIAKYFQNSIREDGLLALAHDGIVYTEGKAGTIQEIFQDAAQNYYRSFGRFSPMVFFGKQYWTETYPVAAVLKSLFSPEEFSKYLIFTDDVAEVHDFLSGS